MAKYGHLAKYGSLLYINEYTFYAKMRQKAYLVVKGLSNQSRSLNRPLIEKKNKDLRTLFHKYILCTKYTTWNNMTQKY